MTRMRFFVAVAALAIAAQAQTNYCRRLFDDRNSSDPLAPGIHKFNEAEAEEKASHRACIKTFFQGKAERWDQMTSDQVREQADWMNHEFTVYESIPLQSRRYLDLDNPRLGPIKAALGRDVSPEEFVNLARIHAGWDREQIRLYGDYLYVLKLWREGNYARCAATVARIKTEGRLKVKGMQFDSLDEHSYWQPEALRNFVAAVGLSARSKLPGDNPALDIAAMAEYLETSQALHPFYEIATIGDPLNAVGDPGAALLARMSRHAALFQVDMPVAKKLELLDRFPTLAGFVPDEDGVNLYLRGSSLHVLQLTRDGEVNRLSAGSAAEMFDQYCRRQMAKYESPRMALFRVLKEDDGGFEVAFGDKDLKVSRSDYQLLRSGKALSPDHPLTVMLKDDARTKVLYSHPLMEKDGAFQRDADDFTYVLQRSYPDVRIVRDPLSEKTEVALNSLTSFAANGVANVQAIVADETFRPRVVDYRIIQNIKAYLVEKGMSVTSFSGTGRLPKMARGNGLIVITAHSNEALGKFVQSLGDAGALEGQYVVFNSCQTPLTRKLVADMMSKYGATAVYAPEGKIQVAKVSPFMRSLTDQLANQPGRSFADVLSESIQRNGLNGVWTICYLLGLGNLIG